MDREADIRMGRLAVERKLLTQEQVLDLLRRRGDGPAGPDLAGLIAAEGLLDEPVLEGLRREAEAEAAERGRHEASTEREIELGSTREVIARDCLDEALAALDRDRAGAVRELRRLAEEFADTESGNRARLRLRELEEGAGA